MKNLCSRFCMLLSVLLLGLSFTSPLFANDPIKIDTILTDKVSDNNAPTSKDVFSPDTPIIYVFWKSDQLKTGQKIKSVWIADDTNNVAPANYKVDEATFDLNQDFKNKMLSSLPGSYWGGTFQISKPNSGWPVGKYHVEIYVDDALAKSVSFTVAATGAPTVAAPKAAVTPAVSVAPATSAAPGAPAPVAVATSVAASTPAAAAAKSWGAISVDVGDEPSYGVGGGDTKEEANKTAQKFCASAGGKNCGVVISYQQCGAYATSESGSGKAEGATQKAAEAAAIADCKNADCKILTSDCND